MAGGGGQQVTMTGLEWSLRELKMPPNRTVLEAAQLGKFTKNKKRKKKNHCIVDKKKIKLRSCPKALDLLPQATTLESSGKLHEQRGKAGSALLAPWPPDRELDSGGLRAAHRPALGPLPVEGSGTPKQWPRSPGGHQEGRWPATSAGAQRKT